MLKKTIILGALVAVLALGGAHASEIKNPLGVVELFTSQGCSSCPPADKAAVTLVDDGDVVVLAYHVDYWNYLGWTDQMSSPENTKRQYDYGAAMGRSGVYTPQAVLNGRSEMIGTNAAKLHQALETLKAKGEGLSVPIDIGMKGDEVQINIGAGSGKADVLVVYFNSRQQVEIKAGENKGKTIDYRNIVTDVQTVGMWHGEKTSIELPAHVLKLRESDGCVVLLQSMDKDGKPGPILGATMMTSENS